MTAATKGEARHGFRDFLTQGSAKGSEVLNVIVVPF
jgi:hypothetical protein